jgi:hemerythrin-like domain-containing protein
VPLDDALPDAPLEAFSQCHAGILSRLDLFGKLPSLLEAARQAHQVTKQMLEFFPATVYEHHAEEERELFPAVLASAMAGDERPFVLGITERLTREHRQIEAAWERLEPGLKQVAKGHDAHVDPMAISILVANYEAHAHYEEQVFLPLAQKILGRNANHLAALGVSLHVRHALPDVLARYGNRI